MSHDSKDGQPPIPVDLIRETVMPPYEYQKPQNGFGSTNPDQSAAARKVSEKSSVTTEDE